MVVRNSMAYPQTLQKKALVARAVAMITVPEPLPDTRVWEGEDGPLNPHTPKLTVRQWQGKLFEELDLSGLDFIASGAGRCCLPAFCQVPVCLFFRTCGIGWHSCYQAYNQGDR